MEGKSGRVFFPAKMFISLTHLLLHTHTHTHTHTQVELSPYRDSLEAEPAGDRIPVGAKYSAPV
jgi:hypothetical protein